MLSLSIKISGPRVPPTEFISLSIRVQEKLRENRIRKLWKSQGLITGQILSSSVDTIIYGGVGLGRSTAVLIGIAELLARQGHTGSQPSFLIISPTYELAITLGELMSAISPFPDSVMVCSKDFGNSKDLGEFGAVTASVVIGTPRTLIALSNQGKISLRRLTIAVYEDVERLFAPKSEVLLHTKALTACDLFAERCVILGESQPSDVSIVNRFLRSCPPTTIRFIGRSIRPNIEWIKTNIDPIHVIIDALREHVSQDPTKSWIVYVDHIVEARRAEGTASSALDDLGTTVAAIHHAMTPRDRYEIFQKFQNTSGSVLISCEIMLGGVRTRASNANFAGTRAFRRLAKACCKHVSKVMVFYEETQEDRRRAFQMAVDGFFNGDIECLDLQPQTDPQTAGPELLQTPTCKVRLFGLPFDTPREVVMDLLWRNGIPEPRNANAKGR